MNKEPRRPPSSSPRIDLHSHSHFSDGDHPPEAVARMAREAGLAAQALTDHDCLDGLEEFRDSANGFEAVSGVEISARKENVDVHVLGLFISPDDTLLRERLEGLAATRTERIRAMILRLRDAKIEVSEDFVRGISPLGTIGRPHLAMALVRLGAAASVDEAFQRYLRPGMPGFVPKPGPAPAEAISWIHDGGGVAVLAHPGTMRRNRWIPEFVQAGLDGIEVWHPKHNRDQREGFLNLAESLDLVACGGSDYHGASVGNALIGQEPVPLETLDRLRERRPRT